MHRNNHKSSNIKYLLVFFNYWERLWPKKPCKHSLVLWLWSNSLMHWGVNLDFTDYCKYRVWPSILISGHGTCSCLSELDSGCFWTWATWSVKEVGRQLRLGGGSGWGFVWHWAGGWHAKTVSNFIERASKRGKPTARAACHFAEAEPIFISRGLLCGTETLPPQSHWDSTDCCQQNSPSWSLWRENNSKIIKAR